MEEKYFILSKELDGKVEKLKHEKLEFMQLKVKKILMNLMVYTLYLQCMCFVWPPPLSPFPIVEKIEKGVFI